MENIAQSILSPLICEFQKRVSIKGLSRDISQWMEIHLYWVIIVINSLWFCNILLTVCKFFIFFFILCFSADSFIVMCYNVLCDKYCTKSMYGYCPSWALKWEYRKKLIMNEILQHQGDILSLQVIKLTLFILDCLSVQNCSLQRSSEGHLLLIQCYC